MMVNISYNDSDKLLGEPSLEGLSIEVIRAAILGTPLRIAQYPSRLLRVKGLVGGTVQMVISP